MNRFVRRDKVIYTVAAVITVGVLVSRSHHMAGFYISLAGLACLLLTGIPRFIPEVLRYRSPPPFLQRAWVSLQAIIAILIVNSLASGRILYFPVLLVLAAEYFIFDSSSKN